MEDGGRKVEWRWGGVVWGQDVLMRWYKWRQFSELTSGQLTIILGFPDLYNYKYWCRSEKSHMDDWGFTCGKGKYISLT